MLRFLPCNPNEEEIKEFMRTKLQMPDTVITSLRVCNHRQVNTPNRSPGSGRTTIKTEIQFQSIEDRDIVISYAVNLGNSGANVGIVIPDRLLTLQRKLEHYAYRYRNESKERTGSKNSNSPRQHVRHPPPKKKEIQGSKPKIYKEKELPKLQDDDSSEDSDKSEVKVVEDEDDF